MQNIGGDGIGSERIRESVLEEKVNGLEEIKTKG